MNGRRLFRFSGMRFRLALAFFSLGIAPLLLLGGVLVWLTFQSQIDRVRDHQQNMLARLRMETGYFFDGFSERLQRLHLMRNFVALSADEQRKALAILLAERREFREIALIDADGRERVRVTAAQPVFDEDLRSRGHEAGFTYALEFRQVWASPTYLDEVTGEPLMMLMTPLIDRRSGQASAVLAAELRLRTLWQLMAHTDLSDGETVFLLDDAGRLIAHANPSLVLRGLRVTDLGIGRKTGLEGGEVFRLTTELAFAQRRMTLVAEQPVAIALQPALRALIWMLAALLAALAMVILLFWYAVRRIVQPVEDIAAAARAVRSGELTARATVTGNDEIGELAAAFNTMTGELAALLAQQRDFNEQLAARVDERTAQLSAANQELEAFAYSVSHDLRAPLRAIDGFSRIVLEDYGPTLDAEGQRLLGIVRHNALRMQQLINDILHFSHVGRAELKDTTIDMAALAREVWFEVSADALSRAPERKIEFVLGELPPAHGDRAMVRQIWSNLLGNAAKFTQQRPAARIEVRARRQDGLIAYEVQDNGAGFDPAYRDKLFGVFSRLHSAQEFEGTGIGLALVKRIVNRHGGQVWASGQIDAGACIGFSLPAADSTEGSLPESQSGRDGV